MARARLKKGGEHKAGSERWLLTYADMITLLLAFFVVMFSLSNQDLRKYAQLAQSIQQAFNLGQMKAQPAAVDLGSALPGSQPGFMEMSDLIAFDNIRMEFETLATQQGFKDDISVRQTNEGTVITFSGDLLFPSGRAKLKPDSLVVLDKLAQLVGPIKNSVRVEGHTDNIPTARGEFPTNWELSTARATNVVRYLVDFGGIAPERLTAMGWGENKPVESNDTPEGRAHNRRAEVVILYPPAAGGGNPPGYATPAGVRPPNMATSP